MNKTVKLIQVFEYAAARSSGFRSLYGRLFYSRMIAQEMVLGCIGPGARVLHVGCGPMPFTSITLAKMGVYVTAVDTDKRALERACEIIKAEQLEHMITLEEKNGMECDPSTYDAVWISLHAAPKELLIPKLLSGMNKNGKLIYRNPRGWLRLWYKGYYPGRLRGKTKNFLGKESIKLQRQGSTDPVSLEYLTPGEVGIIVEVPPVPHLSALGYRPGKQVRVKVHGALNGPIVAEIDGRGSAVTRSLAEYVKVTPCSGAA